MNTSKHLTRVLGFAAMAAVALGFASAAAASPAPPRANAALFGTWVNTDPSSNSVKQVIVSPLRTGNVSVDAFGACVPTFCEWGTVPAIVYGTDVSATSGASFQTNQRFLSGDTEWSRTTLLGTVARTKVGLRLTLRELTVFEDGSGRRNYNVTETFARSDGSKATVTGNPVSDYRHGTPPALVSSARGNWKNVAPSGGLTKIRISGSLTNPIVQAFGQCSPTDCDWGRSKAITYGTSISSKIGSTLLAPYTFGFKNSQLVIDYSRNADKVEHLTVSLYNEFTDGSGRSNYLKLATFIRA
jgi:hypothetical protein